MFDKEDLVLRAIQEYSFELTLDYLLKIVTQFSFDELEKSICQLLKSSDELIVGDTCGAIRDAIVCGHKYEEFKEFRERYPESLIVNTLEDLLESSDRNSRRHSIYTLGKTCSYNSLPALETAFYNLKEKDPFILSRLFCELSWLGCNRLWTFLDLMVSSPLLSLSENFCHCQIL